MRRRALFYHIILLWFLLIPTAVWGQLSWERYSYPVDHKLSITAIYENSWFQDEAGYIYSYGAHRWQTISPPSSEFKSYHYHYLSPQHLIGVFIDDQFYTYTAQWKDGEWSSPHILANVPLRHIRSNGSEIFLFGDWGELFRWNSDSWQSVPNPAVNHITALTGNPDGSDHYWILERGGILHRKTKKSWQSTPLDLPTVEDITVMYPQADGLHLIATTGNHFLWDGQTLTELRSLPMTGLISMASSTDRKIFYNNTPEFVVTDYHTWATRTLPDYQTVTDAAFDPNGELVLTTSNGDVYYETTHDAPYFIEVASHWYINGNQWDETASAQLVDYNGDHEIDVLLHHPKPHQQNRLYIAKQPARFEDVSNQLPVINHPIQRMFMQDINNDTRPDLLTTHNSTSATIISIYYQDTDGSFFQSQQLQFPLDGFLDLRDLDVADWDNDGDSDLILTFYKSTAVDPGFIAWIPNRYYGHFNPDQLRILPGTEGWNMETTVADLNHNGLLDLYVSTYWSPDHLFLHNRDSVAAASHLLPPSDSTNTIAALVLDWDDDGDLDLIRVDQRSTITLLTQQEDGQYLIDPVSDTLRDLLNGYQPYAMTHGDFNRDGYPDLVLLTEHNKQQHIQLLLNQGGRTVIDHTQASGLLPYPANRVYTYDFNADGVDDLFTVGRSHNQLFLNQYSAQQVSERAQITNSTSSGPRLSQLISLLFLRIRSPSFIYYLGLFVLAGIITLSGIREGISRFQWTPALSSTITMINFSAFWIIIDQFGTAHWLFGMALPILIVLIGVILPLGISYQLARLTDQSAHLGNEQELLSKLLEFTHGTWAMSVLNSLRMLSRNADPQLLSSTDLANHLQERFETFTTLLAPELEHIIELIGKSRWAEEYVHPLRKTHVRVTSLLGSQVEDFALQIQKGNGEQIAQSIEQLQHVLKQLRHAVFAQYSCDITKVSSQVVSALEPELKQQHISLDWSPDELSVAWGLIPSGDLANIVDNCIHNAQKAIHKGGYDRRISIRVRRAAPRLQIEISDTGCGIPEEQLDQIFEQGFSGFKSTGLGLHQARQTLQQFGGDIMVKSTQPGQGTTFIISLLEGVAP